MANPDNPYDVCTWRPVSECTGCSIEGRLKCRFKLGDLLHFVGMFLGFAIPAVIGMILGEYSRYLWDWAVFCLIFFELW
jgi:hypothetical protein